MALLFAKRVFQAAGIWGVFILALGYGAFLLGADGTNTNHPELVHGFFLVTFAFQIVFFIIATDPVRYRMLMLAAMLEKFPFTLVTLSLYALTPDQTSAWTVLFGLIDGVLGVLFAISYFLTDGAD